ncbi:hypothetical protein ACVWW4_005944 [Bradyrhizobium sp. LB7.1]
MDAATAALARLQDRHCRARADKLTRRHQAGRARADNDDVL